MGKIFTELTPVNSRSISEKDFTKPMFPDNPLCLSSIIDRNKIWTINFGISLKEVKQGNYLLKITGAYIFKKCPLQTDRKLKDHQSFFIMNQSRKSIIPTRG